MRPQLAGRRPAHATVIAYLALFVALGGSAVAAGGVLIKKPSEVGKGVITSRALKNGKAVKVKDLTPAARSALTGASGPAGGALTGSYPNPLLAVGAVGTAAFAASATAPNADKLDGKDSSDFLAASATAPNADKLDGKDSSDFLAAPGAGWHFVGEAGEPPFLSAAAAPNLDGLCAGGANSWSNYQDGYTRAAFFRDSLGIVHLSGLVKGGQLQCAIFQLPAGYRPDERAIFPILVNPDVLGRLDVAQAGVGSVSGVVVPRSAGGTNTYVSLSGISFPCGPSGQDGCP